MADKLLQQGKDVQWLCDDTTGAALVRIKASDVSLGAAVEYATLYDQNAAGTEAYVGKALPGTLTSAGSWQIKKLVYGSDGDVTTTFADGDALFNNIWDNRAILSYS